MEEEKANRSPSKEIQKGITQPSSEVTFSNLKNYDCPANVEEFENFLENVKTISTEHIKHFEGGRIKHFVDNWQDLTSDEEILNTIQGLKLEFMKNPCQTQCPHQRQFNQAESAAIEKEVQNLLEKQVIAPSSDEDDQFLSPIFVREKKNGSYRLICNLKEFNKNIEYHHFKMESCLKAIQMITPNCYMASIDLKDAYYCVPIAEEFQKYLKFKWNSQLYRYLACPMGLCVSPRVFTKLLKPVFANLRKNGFQSVIYIDDTFLQGETIEACNKNVKATATALIELGFVINIEKSVLQASKRIEFLGFILDSEKMTVSLTEQKITKIETLCKKCQKSKVLSIRECSKLIGTLVATFPAVPHGKLFYRQIENDKIKALKSAKGDFDREMKLSQVSKQDIKWWIENIRSSNSPISKRKPDLIIETDSSQKGWGCYCRETNQSAGGKWKDKESDHHINVLELQAAFFALRAICNQLSDIHVHLMMDSMTAVSYVREQGGSKSLTCNNLAREIWLWALSKNIWLSSAHIPGKMNTIADSESRKFATEHEWMLDPQIFSKLIEKLGFQPSIDLFASRLNCQVNKYVSWRPEPESFAIDAFSLNWENLQFYCFPPFSVIPAVLQKVKQDQATGILILPDWPTQSYYSTVMRMLIQNPVYLKRNKQLLKLPGSMEKTHKIWEHLNLLGCLISGNMSKINSYQKTLPVLSWPHGDQRLQGSTTHTSVNGNYSVIDKKLITFVPL
jgi:hypothetical protein